MRVTARPGIDTVSQSVFCQLFCCCQIRAQDKVISSQKSGSISLSIAEAAALDSPKLYNFGNEEGGPGMPQGGVTRNTSAGRRRRRSCHAEDRWMGVWRSSRRADADADDGHSFIPDPAPAPPPSVLTPRGKNGEGEFCETRVVPGWSKY